jgi:hypothetical protein
VIGLGQQVERDGYLKNFENSTLVPVGKKMGFTHSFTVCIVSVQPLNSNGSLKVLVCESEDVDEYSTTLDYRFYVLN